MKERAKIFFRLFGGAVAGAIGFFASLLFIVATAPTPWLLFGVVGMVVSGTFIGTGIYSGCAELHLLRRKAGPHTSGNYRRGLRKLKRKRAEAVRKLYSMKSYSNSPAYYLEVIEAEKAIAKHMGIDYVKPDYLPKDRWS